MITFDQKEFGVLCFWKGEGSKGKEIRMRSFGGEVFWNVCKRLIETDLTFLVSMCLCKEKKGSREKL